jgi:hypothetical protein
MSRWCRVCGEPVTLLGAAAYQSPELSKAVHEATSRETGPDGHLAAPIDVNPAQAGRVTPT